MGLGIWEKVEFHFGLFRPRQVWEFVLLVGILLGGCANVTLLEIIRFDHNYWLI